MKRCAECNQEFAPARERARFCSALCRSAAWKARNGYADPRRPNRVRNGNGGRRRVGARKPTTYTVEAVEPDGFRYIGRVDAHDALSAILALADDPEGIYRAIPVSRITEATGTGEKLART